MPELANSRREKLAQALAAGKNKTEAMAYAGYKDNRNSHRLTNINEVVLRVSELQHGHAQKNAITVEGQTAKLERAYAMADKLGKPDAMVNAVREQSVLNGIRIERSEHGAAGEFAALSDKDLAEQLHTRLQTALAVAQQKEATEH